VKLRTRSGAPGRALAALKAWAQAGGRRLDSEEQEWQIAEAVRRRRIDESEADEVRALLGRGVAA
jgi:hypothetical protein